MSLPSPPFRLAAALVAFILTALAPTPAAAQDSYYWNAPSGTTWTAPNAWQFGSTDGPAATWVSGGRAVFDNTSAGIVALSTDVSASHIEFAGTAPLTIAKSPASVATLSVTGAGTIGTITVSTSSLASINAPLGGTNIGVLRNSPAHTISSLKLGSANTFTGNLTVGAGGTFSDETNVVRLASGGALPTTAAVRFTGLNAAVVFDRGFSAAHTLPNTIELNTSGVTGSLTNSFRAATLTAVTFSGTITGTGGLTLSVDPDGTISGTGSVFALTRANAYSGNTTVANGVTLLVNNPLSGTDTATGIGGVNVNGRIGGTGRIGGSFVSAQLGLQFGGTGRLAPGDPAVNGGVGQLRVTQTVGWIANGTYEVQLGGVTDTDANRDQLRTDGTLRIDAANAKVKVDVSKVGTFTFSPGQTYTYRIAQANDGITMLGGAGGQFDPSRFEVTSSFAAAGDFTLSYEDGLGTENYLVLNYVAPVPEPSLILLVCATAAGAATRPWRRRGVRPWGGWGST